jgi:hypothetical protein
MLVRDRIGEMPELSDPQLNTVLKYLDKEATLMGLLAVSATAAAGFIAKSFLLNASAYPANSAVSSFMAAGCLWLLASALCFGGQRNKIMSRYGEICLSQLGLSKAELTKMKVEDEARTANDLPELLVDSIVFSRKFGTGINVDYRCLGPGSWISYWGFSSPCTRSPLVGRMLTGSVDQHLVYCARNHDQHLWAHLSSPLVIRNFAPTTAATHRCRKHTVHRQPHSLDRQRSWWKCSRSLAKSVLSK